MGSLGYDIPQQLEVLRGNDGHHLIDSSAEDLVDTIWAIVSFIYTGDSDTSFLRLAEKPPSSKETASGLTSCQLHYYFDDNTSASTLGKYRTETDHHLGSDFPAGQYDQSLPSFTQLVKKVALLVTDLSQSPKSLQKLQSTHEELIILHVALDNGALVSVNFLDPREHHSSLANIADTVQRVNKTISQEWETPLRRLKLLGSRNWQIIRDTAPATADVSNAVLGDILTHHQQSDKVAVESWDGDLTYKELYEHSRSMAAFLLMSGLQPEDRIGFYMKKSKWSIVAFCGILMAGCTGVPLDIRNPPKRTEALLHRVDAKYIIADEWTAPSLEDVDIGILPCEADVLEAIDASDDSLTWPTMSSSTVALILFTSGSTGLPKGVVIEHGPLYASIIEIARALFLEDTSKTFQFSPFISDISIGDIFATLLVGGTLFMPSEEQKLDSLSDTLRLSKASHASLTSTVMSQVEPKDVPDLRYMVAIGEALSKDNWLRWSPHVFCMSAYGITETLVLDSFAFPEHLAADYRSIGVGMGPCLWVTDLNNPEHVMPIGAVGEILIEGPLLAREYLGAPELTAARFIQAPEWLRSLRNKRHGHRCYRTGDYGIRNADGSVLYLGRADNQVKIRGQRVELNEIEHSLVVCDDRLTQVAIELVRLENRGQDEVLIAFVQRPGPEQADSSGRLLKMDDESRNLFLDVQSKLQETMPSYMVPGIFLPIRDIPKGALGKRDRNTLRRLGATLAADQLVEYRLHGSRPRHPVSASVDEQDSAEFWKNQFLDFVDSFPLLPSPVYKPDARTTQSLNMSLRHSISTSTTIIQAAWALVSCIYANTEEDVFGLALPGKDVTPLRIRVDYASSVAEYLDKVQQYVTRAHQFPLSLKKIASLSEETCSATKFQSLLVIRASNDSAHPSQSVAESAILHRSLILEVDMTTDSVHIEAHFDEEVISQGQMQSILALLELIIDQLAATDSTQSLYNLNKSSAHDQHLLSAWNAEMPQTVSKTLHGMFEAQVSSTPDAVALESSTESLTYGELDRRATSLARYLAKHLGDRREPRVMLCFTKSVVPIVAIIATLKAGGVCASVNPEHPISRLVELSKDVDAALLLCDNSLVGMWNDQDLAPPVLGISDALIQQLASPLANGTGAASLPTVQPDNASFIIYTSGTTGKPKASVLEHQNLATGLMAVAKRVGLDSQSRTLQFSAYTFDAHILEIFTTLIHGGCVCVISDHERMDCLAEVIQRLRPNIALLTKTVGRLLEPSEVPSLQTLILAGEQNGRQDWQRWAPHVRLFNGLGPSECTPLASVSTCPVSPTDDPSNVGSALGCCIWITDYRNPDVLMPVGCIGELTIEGPIVGRGYIGRLKENAASFIQGPKWSRENGSGKLLRRFYRTGDLAKMNHDGSITFIGRADNQVKINGQRVELGEIDDQLRRQSEAFASSVVDVLTLTSRGASVLVVFCTRPDTTSTLAVPQSNHGNAVLTMDEKTRIVFEDVQARLLESMPQYMVPKVFIPVARLPINASGKLERKTLQKWAAELDVDSMDAYYLGLQDE